MTVLNRITGVESSMPRFWRPTASASERRKMAIKTVGNEVHMIKLSRVTLKPRICER